MGANNPLALEQFARLAVKNLDKVMENELPAYQEMIGTLFGTAPLDKAFYEAYGVGSVPDIPVFTGKLDFLDIAPDYYTRIEPKEYAGAIQIQKKFIEDKQYPVLDNRVQGMVRAYGRTKEKTAAKFAGYAFSASWDFMTNEEGVALCSASHTTKSGVSTASGFSNYGTSALSKTSVAATRILFRKFRDDIGELYDSEPDTLLVPEALYDTACEIVGVGKNGATSMLDSASANNTINTLYKGFKVIPWRRLDELEIAPVITLRMCLN